MKLSHPWRSTRRVLGTLVVAASPLAAQTYGDAVIARPSLDGFGNFLTVSSIAFAPGSLGGALSAFSLFGGTGAVPGFGVPIPNVNGQITPLLVRNTGGANWSVVGVGTTRFIASGVNNFAFGLVSGSAIVGADEYFAWHSPNGAVLFTQGGPSHSFSGNLAFPTVPTAGTAFTTSLSDTRTYSMQWTVTPGSSSTVPEPSTYALMTAGLLFVGALRRRQRSRAG